MLPTVLLLAFLLPGGRAHAGLRILAIQSLDIKPYTEAIQGFAEECQIPVERWVLPDIKPVPLEDKLQEIRPSLIIAVGSGALNAIRGVEGIPVLYMMVLDPELSATSKPNATGVQMMVDPRVQIRMMAAALPGIKRLGTIYHPEKTGSLVDEARRAAEGCGIELAALPVSRVGEVPQKARELGKRVEAFWLLPDVTVITPETIEYLLLFSLEFRIPIIAFSAKYLELGAVMSIGIDSVEIGRQAGRMAREILHGKAISEIPPEYVRKPEIQFNVRAARKLNVVLDTNGATARACSGYQEGHRWHENLE